MSVEHLQSSASLEMHHIAASVVAEIEGADHAAVSRTGSHGLLASTSMLAERLEATQQSSGVGPSVDAAQSGKIERINYLSDHTWPEFESACAECGIRSVAAFPIQTGSAMIGVFTVYSSDHHAFGAPELRIGRAAAVALVALVGDEVVQ